jgi:protocatechuate 3,4-dioxygenase beta subunit
MNRILLAILLLQGATQNLATVTGTVLGASGEPAAGVRVYAVAVRDVAGQTNDITPALDGLTETDSAGHFKLQVAAGRYYIAAGSVALPTYFPGTSNLTAARVLNLSAGGIIEGIDFSNFVTALRVPENPFLTIPVPPPGSTGVLSGVIHFSDGRPAAGQQVIAVPASAMAGGAPTAVRYFLLQSVTDINGRYRFEKVPPDVYYIATGSAENPTLFPGVADLQNATTIATTPTTNLDALDFNVTLHPRFTITGRVTGPSGTPAAGVMVRIMPLSIMSSPLAALRLRPAIPLEPVTVGIDGSFEFSGVVPGTYSVQTVFSSFNDRTTVVILDRSARVDLSIPVPVLTGRILGADGSPLPGPQIFEDVVATLVESRFQTSTIFPIATDGSFGRFFETGEYLFHLRTLPDEYAISSFSAGGVDLLKEKLNVTGTESIQVDIRVVPRTAGPRSAGVSVSGTVLDSLSGTPAVAERMELCCEEGAFPQKLSTPLRSDGTFTFATIPPGHYSLGLKARPGQPDLHLVQSGVDVGDQDLSGLDFVSTPQLGLLGATVVAEGGTVLPENFPASVVFTGTGGRARVVAQRGTDGIHYASLPIGDRYAVSLVDLPGGYSVKSIVGSTEVRPVNYPAIGAPPPLVPIVITIGMPPSPR